MLVDNLSDNTRKPLVLSKSSLYWLNESIRSMQSRVDYGSPYQAVLLAELTEIERHLKALKMNGEKNGWTKTFVFRAEALINFIPLCRALFGSRLS
jgi:hypothetical protein